VGVHLLPARLRDLISGLTPVEEIVVRTQTERLMKIYDQPMFPSTLEFLTMLALSTGRLLKVRLSPSLLQNSKKPILSLGWHPRHPPSGKPEKYLDGFNAT
jgi:hypothetical protein